MDKGIVIFAHNSQTLDYVYSADIAAGYASRKLNSPVTLITDHKSVTGSKSKLSNIDNLLIIDRPQISNTRLLLNQHIDFINTNRHLAFTYSPYQRTLLIDSDFFILTDRLNQYWNSDKEFLITSGMNALGTNLSPETVKLSSTTVTLRWATAMMFSKTENVENIFKTVEYVKDNWDYFIDMYNLPSGNFRNDYAFTIANHIVYGFRSIDNLLPSPLYALENYSVKKFSKDDITIDEYVINTDVHIMNKFSIQDAENGQ